MPGITSCSIEEGDVVLKPKSQPGEITPAATAFLLRPVDRKPRFREKNDFRYRFVGLCFVPEGRDVDEHEFWFLTPDKFAIV